MIETTDSPTANGPTGGAPGLVIIGAGQAAVSCIEALAAARHAGPVHLVGAEPHLPYQRPPLSKAYLKGEMQRERLSLKPRAFYDQAGVTLHLGRRATKIDRNARFVTLDDGTRLAYGQLALFTGATPRRLPAAIGGALAGVHVVRSITDIDALAPELAAGPASPRRVLVVGGGYVGLEIAAVARQAGLEVTLVEAGARILGRVACPETAECFRNLHRAHGVEVIEDAALSRLTGTARVTGALLADGRELPADLVVVGIGVDPETALAEAAGLAVDNGIRTDRACRTSDPSIFAGGDCARFDSATGPLRLESVPNAIAMGQAVAAGMLGQAVTHDPVPWFWSDQYDVKLQIAGLGAGHDRVIARPGARPGAMALWYFRGHDLLACDAMNDPKSWMTARRWLADGVHPDPDLIADAAVPLADTVPSEGASR